MRTYQDFEQAKYHSSKRPAYSMIPTPTASDAKMSRKKISNLFISKNDTIRLRNKTGGSSNVGLANHVLFFPTPTTQDGKNNGSISQKHRNTVPINAIVEGLLNPDWEEWLMGYPVGWTDPDKKRIKHEYLGDQYTSFEPKKLPRITNKKKNRVARIESIGNAIQPQVAYEIYKIIDFIDNLNQPQTCKNENENQPYRQ